MEKTVKIKFHSFVDVITNSSTVIYTYQSGAIEPVKEVINEMLKLQGIDKKADDLFYFGAFCEEDIYTESEECPFKDKDYKKNEKDMIQLIDDILMGKKEQPEWMNEAEGEDSDGFAQSSSLHIKPKEKKHQHLAELLLKFLNSAENEATRDG